MRILKLYIACLLALTTYCSLFSAAQQTATDDRTPAIDHDSGAWGFLFLRAQLRSATQGQLEISPRIGSNGSQLQTLLIRPSFIFQITPQLSSAVGYLAMPRWNNDGIESVEHRSWQQVQGNLNLRRVLLIPRIRFEQRFRGVGPNEIAHRLRAMLRAQVPVLRLPNNQPLINIVVFDELFLNLGAVPQWTESGFDQNRAFAGASVRLNDQTVLETGYMNQFLNLLGSGLNRMSHLFILNLTVDF